MVPSLQMAPNCSSPLAAGLQNMTAGFPQGEAGWGCHRSDRCRVRRPLIAKPDQVKMLLSPA